MTASIPTNGFLIEGAKPVSIVDVPVVFADKPGRNKNVYSKNTLQQAIVYYENLTKLDPTYKYAFAKHPKNEDEEWLGLIAGTVEKLYFDDASNMVKADFTLLPTIWGHFIGWLLKNNYHVGISLRGEAVPTRGSMMLDGRTIQVVNRTDLRLEGIDFVVYPSYIVTNASKSNVKEKSHSSALPNLDFMPGIQEVDDTGLFQRVVESYLSETSQDSSLSTDELQKLFKSSLTNNQSNKSNLHRRNADMDQANLELKKQQLEVQIEGLDVRKSKLEAEITSVETTYNDVKAKLSQVQESLSEKEGIVDGLSKVEKLISDKRAEYDKLSTDFSAKAEELQKIKAELEEMELAAESKLAVRLAGSVFSELKTPKVRVLGVDERVTEAAWSDVRQDKIKQLAFLASDADIAKQVFGVIGGETSWEGLKFPVYQAFKSDSPDHDVDLVLNINALGDAVNTLFGRTGASLSVKEKTDLISFLKDKYTALENAGISEIPKAIADISSKIHVLESLNFEEHNEFASTVIESAIVNSSIDLGEFEKLTIAGNDAHAKIISAISDILSSSIVKKEVEGDEKDVQEMVDPNAPPVPEGAGAAGSDDPLAQFIANITRTEDGSPTEFAEAFSIETVEDFNANYADKLRSFAEEGDMDTVMSMIQTLVSSYVKKMTDSDAAAPHIEKTFEIVSQILNDGAVEEGMGEEEMGDATDGSQINNDTVYESTQGEQDMIFADLKTILESNFEEMQIDSEQKALKVIEQLITDYQSTYGELQALELSTAKEAKKAELLASAVSESVIDEQFAEVASIDDLNAISDKLLKITKSVSESVKKGSSEEDEGVVKGKSLIPDTKVVDSQEDYFSKLMKSI